MYSKSLGFYDGGTWETHSGSSIIVGNSTKTGVGILQTHTMQIMIAFFGGGALGLAGALLQKVTKNRLAEVSILGIGSINIFFIYIYAVILKDKAFSHSFWGYAMPVFLIVVSVIGTLIIWAISRSKRSNKNTFVIVGIALQLLVEGLSVIIVNPKKLTQAGNKEGTAIWHRIQGYTLGKVRSGVEDSLQNADTNPVPWWLMILVVGIIIVVIGVVIFLRRKIDTYETSEELSTSVGINIKRLRLVIFLLVALLAGAASAVLGTVALLGIIAPSVARMLFRNKMLPLAISSFVIGGIMVGLASFISMQLEASVSVGILATAIVIPYFIFQMIKER